MKLRAGDLAGFLRRSPPAAGLLIHGPDPVAVDLSRDEAVSALLGPGAEAEMRLQRIDAAALRGDPAALQDALHARGFFPGPRAVVVEGAGDGLADLVAAALGNVTPGEDAFLLVTATRLPARSRLRRLFEQARDAAALQLFDDPPGRAEVERILAGAGASAATREAVEMLATLARDIDAGSLRQLCAAVVLHGGGRVGAEDVAALAPQALEAGLDSAIAAAAEGRGALLARQMARLDAQGVAPTALCVAAGRHFRALLTAACDPGGPEAGLERLRPPVYGPRRAAMLAQIRRLGPAGIEAALRLVHATDLALRSGAEIPARALVGAALMRIARTKPPA
ncbi:MAG: DNA polymerase III subunit delta [Alphaproteobacteria bacterium]|nr:MAG: DNA polymerase III subunit delta [Alphaproteobacteria bacterium]